MPPTDPFADLHVVLVNIHAPDTAVATLEMPFDEYVESRDDKLIKVKPGRVAVLFQVQRISWRFIAQVVNRLGTDDMKNIMAFGAACHAIYELDSEGNRTERARVTAVRDSVHGVMVAPDSWADAIAAEFSPWALYEVGQVARQFAMMTAAQRKVFSYPAG
jgi:hypothetical protein